MIDKESHVECEAFSFDRLIQSFVYLPVFLLRASRRWTLARSRPTAASFCIFFFLRGAISLVKLTTARSLLQIDCDFICKITMAIIGCLDERVF